MKWLVNKYSRKTRRGLRIQDLGISNISKTLNEIASPTKKSMNPLFRPKSKTNVVLEPRRSSLARNSVPSYAEVFGTNLPQLRKGTRSKSSSWGSYAYAARSLKSLAQTFHNCGRGQGQSHHHGEVTLTLQGHYMISK